MQKQTECNLSERNDYVLFAQSMIYCVVLLFVCCCFQRRNSGSHHLDPSLLTHPSAAAAALLTHHIDVHANARICMESTPNGKEKNTFKFYCPICFMHFKGANTKQHTIEVTQMSRDRKLTESLIHFLPVCAGCLLSFCVQKSINPSVVATMCVCRAHWLISHVSTTQ